MIKTLNALPVLILVISIFGYSIASTISQLSGVENVLLSIAVRAVVVAISLISIFLVLKEIIRNKRDFIGYFLILFLSLFLITFFTRAYLDSLIRGNEFSTATLQNFWLFFVGVTFIPAIASAMSWRFFISNNSQLCWLGVLFGLLSLCLILYAWSQQNIIASLIGGRIEFDTLNPISIGHVAVSSLIFAFCYRASNGGSKSNYVIFYLVLFLGVTIMVAAGSRGPIQSLVAVYIFYVLFSSKVKFKVKFTVLSVGVLAFLIAYSLSEHSGIAARMTTKLFDDPARIQIINESVAVFSLNFFSGAGIMSTQTYPHNFILESFVVLGVFGGSIFIVLNVVALTASIYLYNRKISSILPLLFIQYFVAGLFSGTLHEAAPYWITLSTLLFVFSNLLHAEKKAKRKNYKSL